MKLAFQWYRSWAGCLARSAATLSVLAIGLSLTLAAPFDKQFQFTQSDGTVITIHGKGDEFSAVFESLEGYTVVYDPVKQGYCYADLAADGRLVSTGVQVHQASPATLGVPQHLRMSREARRQMVVERYLKWENGMQVNQRWEELKANNRAYEEALKNGANPAPPNQPTVGVKVGLTLLVDFSDDPATVPQADIVSYLNADNYNGYGNNGSVKKYFEDVSNGLLTYSNVVTIYITAPQPKTTYNDVTQDAGLMGNNLLKDVLDTMKALPDYNTTILPTFDNLTVDNNNQVVACNVFFAGANSGVWSMGLWPHSWALVVVGAQELSPGGKKVFRYQITDIGNRLAIGTFAHENGHMLCGYPDIYDYDYDSVGGAGVWCLMNSGGIDFNPSQVCAYLKRASGWSTVTEINATSTLVGLVSSVRGTNFNHFYRYQKPGSSTEYFLIENRQANGRDSWLPGSGIAIWHVDELGDRDNQSLAFNTSHANYECTLVQADNQWHFQRNMNAGDAYDLWHAENNSASYRNQFDDGSTPSARWWDGSNSGLFLSDFGSNANHMTFRIGQGMSLKVSSTVLFDGNGNNLIDFNECSDLFIVLTNAGGLTASNVSATLATTTPGVVVAQPFSAYPDIVGGGLGTNRVAFKVSTAPDFNCGMPIQFFLTIKTDSATATNNFAMQTGSPGLPLRFDSAGPVVIPDNGETNSTVVVSNLAFAANKIAVSMYINHTWDGDLLLQLISPEGITNTLSRYRGGSGQNYGLACAPEFYRTTFDDAAGVAIGAGVPPFLGSFRPEQPLAVFMGKAGTNLNGTWRLRVVDSSRFDVGTIQCWSLHVTPTVCSDGSGECPGSDLAVGLTAQPEPVTAGGDIVYTINVTNRGPSTAKSVTVSQLLPASVIYRSSQASQGAVSAAGNVVTCNLGRMAVGGRATVTVQVTTTTAGTMGSSATASSEQTDFDPSNNTATFVSHVNPPNSDLVVGISPSVSTVPLGGTITYTVSVTNKGPSTASGVVLTNTFSPEVMISSAVGSQGSTVTASNLVVSTFNSLAVGARATATISVVPVAEGVVILQSRVKGLQDDPIGGNNLATLAVGVGPAADLALTIADNPDPVVTGRDVTYTFAVTNKGPSSSAGVVMNASIAAGITIKSVIQSAGTISQTNNNILVDLGTVPNGGSATLVVIGTATVDGTNVTSGSVFGAQPDPVSGNNNVTITTLSAGPFIRFIPAGANLVAESVVPANGAIDANETVTAKLFLRNAGNIDASNVVATLVAGNGIIPITVAPQTYGDLVSSGLPVGKDFAFTVGSSANVTAVLRVQMGSTETNVPFAFTLPATRSLTNSETIVIRDNNTALPYPSTINVSGVTGVVGKVTATLRNFHHTYPKDASVLLVGPAGQKVVLMSGAGAAFATNATLTFDQTAAFAIPTEAGQLLTGSYRPANYSTALEMPSVPGPYSTTLEVFNSVNPNGAWKLYVKDGLEGDEGAIPQGWSLAFTLLRPVNQVADLALAAAANPSAVLAGSDVTLTYNVANSGPNSASFAAFNLNVPAGATLISASASQGDPVIIGGGQVTANLNGIAPDAAATVTVVIRPETTGSLVCTGTVASPAETDLNMVNNTASATVQVSQPVTDLACSLESVQKPVVLSSNFLFSVVVTNQGTNVALNVVVTNTLPAGVAFRSSNPLAGVATNGQMVVWTIGNLAPASAAKLELELQGVAVTNDLFLAAAFTGSTDLVASNNFAQAALFVSYPTPAFESAGAVLRSEIGGATNGTVDANEQIKVSLALKNIGSRDVTNLVAKLRTGNGVANPGADQVYDVVLMNGAAVSRDFTFTATATGDGIVTATLELSEGGTNALGTVDYAFNLPATATFANAAPVTIPSLGAASVYPLTNTVSGMIGTVSKVRVKLLGLTHKFPMDLGVLLVSPTGEQAQLMARAGGGVPINTGVDLTFDDAASAALPRTTGIATGTYRPTAYDPAIAFLPPAPPAPYATTLAAMNGIDPNGVWSLFILDDRQGDGGALAGGWSLEVTTVKTVNPLADLGVTMLTSPEAPFVGQLITNVITVNNLGPAKATGVVISHQLPAGVVFVSGPAGATGDTNGLVVCPVGDLDAGGSVTASILARPEFGGDIINQATVISAAEADLQSGNNYAETRLLVFAVENSVLSGVIEGSNFAISFSGQPGLSYELQKAINLGTWSAVSTNVCPPSGIIKVVEPLSAEGAFYRSMRVAP